MNKEKKQILVVAAHSDDEVLGCGGTLARHRNAGDQVTVIFFTDGVSSRCLEEEEAAVTRRQEASQAALGILGVGHVHRFNFPDNAMDQISRLELTQTLEAVVSTLQPSIVYTHHPCDLNVDHRRVHEVVMTCFRPLPGGINPDIYLFEVLSSTGWASPQMSSVFVPRHYVGIEEVLAVKIQALQAYHEELRSFPHVRSIEGVKIAAQYRGSQIGIAAAEAFDVVRTSC